MPIAIVAPNYRPPPSSSALLGQITAELSQAKMVRRHFSHGGDSILVLPAGQLYFEGPLEVDTDGSSLYRQDPTGQQDTSLRDAHDRPLDANRIPYFVLPHKHFCEQFHIELGDLAAIIYRGRLAFAVFGDTGPANKLGEGSVALHRALGHETLHRGKFVNEGIDSGVITIVFPGSRIKDGPLTPERIRIRGRALFASLGGNIP